MVTASFPSSLLAGCALLAITSSPASAQVVDWFIFKEKLYDQTADNTPSPVAIEFAAGVIIEVASAGDAAFASISGGGIAGSMPLVYEPDYDAWVLEISFPSTAAMDALMPNSAVYTLTLGGGTLGNQVQSVLMPAQAYPNTPYLTGGVLSAMSAYPSQAPFVIGWNDPGPLTSASGNTWFDIEDSSGNIAFEQEAVGAVFSAPLPANTLSSTQQYQGYLTFTNSFVTSPGAFGVSGTSHQAVSMIFEIESTAISYCTAGTSASGCVATLSTTGMPSASSGSGFTVSATGVEGNKDGLFFLGTSGRQANAWGNGSSFQCVVPPVKRFGLLAINGSNGACNGSKSQDFNAHWSVFPSKNPGPGAVVQTQLWYRDPFNTGNQTTSLSDAIEFTVNP